MKFVAIIIPYLFVEFQSLIETAEERIGKIKELYEHKAITFIFNDEYVDEGRYDFDVTLSSIVNGVDIIIRRHTKQGHIMVYCA